MFSVKNGHQVNNKLVIKGCRKMSILKTSSSPLMLDQVYVVPDETASKDTRLGYKAVLHIVQSHELKAHVFQDICGVFNNWRKRKTSNEVPEAVSRPQQL